MMKIESFVRLNLSYFVFNASARFSSRGASLLVSHCKSVRAESKFDAFYADVLTTLLD